MCGFTGYLSRSVLAECQTGLAMASKLSHRGPDTADAWSDSSAGIVLAHRRLAILDLSDAGKQPMESVDGRYVIAFNGEIYNHKILRKQLEELSLFDNWRGHSDTETLLAAIQAYGLKKALPLLNGMFAFALWDRSARKLYLARDRGGEKPLYYGRFGGSVLFGSELKAFRQFPGWSERVNNDVLSLYLRHGYVPDPYCIIDGFFKLPAGHWLELNGLDFSDPLPYWSLKDTIGSQRDARDTSVLVDELEGKLLKAVGLRMESDVPLGAFLSGGLDSSTIVALMQAQSVRPVDTFTIGFNVPGYNEAENAKAIAKHLGTSHTELYVTANDALDVVPELPCIWDEPFADSSQVPTLLLSRLAKRHVTVALSGDAGDELFCGYNRYNQGYSLFRSIRGLPAGLRLSLAYILRCLPAAIIDAFVNYLPQRFRYPALGDRLNKLGAVIRYGDDSSFYRALVSLSHSPSSLLLESQEPETLLSNSNAWPCFDDFRELMMYLDMMTYLPGDILTKVDRASMATSLEARVPFLDNDVIDFAWNLPLDVKQRDGESKWIIRKVLERYVPNELVDRPKMGFGVPIERWLKHELKDWAEELLSPSKLNSGGNFDVAEIRRLWCENKSGVGRHHNVLWAVLMFQAWRESP